MKKNILIRLSCLTILITILSCSSESSNDNDISIGPRIITNIKSQFMLDFKYQNNLILRSYCDYYLPLTTMGLNENIWEYDTDNKLQEIMNSVVLEYGNDGKLASYIVGENGVSSIRSKIELIYQGNKIIQKVYWGEPVTINGVDTFQYTRFAYEGYVIIENGNIIEKNIGDQTILKYTYDNNNSPFSKIENFDLLQIIFAQWGAIGHPYIYRIDELFYGKNNITRKSFLWVPTDKETIIEYKNTYNSSGFPTFIDRLSNNESTIPSEDLEIVY